MTFEQIHNEIFNLIACEEVKELMTEDRIFYYFPPKKSLDIFPRIHFRIENVRSRFIGDDNEIISEARVVVNIYDVVPTWTLSDHIVNSMLNAENGKHIALDTSSDSYDPEDGVHGKQLTFLIKYNK